jgi:anti-anti-sigma factor
MITGQLEIKDIACGNTHTLVMSGELEMVSAADLANLIPRLCATGTKAVVLDLSKITFLDSMGLRTIVAAHKLCEEHACELQVSATSKVVRRALELAGLDHLVAAGSTST